MKSLKKSSNPINSLPAQLKKNLLLLSVHTSVLCVWLPQTTQLIVPNPHLRCSLPARGLLPPVGRGMAITGGHVLPLVSRGSCIRLPASESAGSCSGLLVSELSAGSCTDLPVREPLLESWSSWTLLESGSCIGLPVSELLLESRGSCILLESDGSCIGLPERELLLESWDSCMVIPGWEVDGPTVHIDIRKRQPLWYHEWAILNTLYK